MTETIGVVPLVRDGLAMAKQRYRSEALDTIINIGLIAGGEDEIRVLDPKMKGVAIKASLKPHLYVIEVVTAGKVIKEVFRAEFRKDSFNIVEFKRGLWERVLEQRAKEPKSNTRKVIHGKQKQTGPRLVKRPTVTKGKTKR